MHQRNGAIASIRITAHQHLPSATTLTVQKDINMPELTTSISTVGGGKTTLTKKLLLTLLVLVQICFISCLWLLQLGGDLSSNANINEITMIGNNTKSGAVNSKGSTNVPYLMAMRGARGVNFITKTSPPNERMGINEGVLKHNLSSAVVQNSSIQSGNEHIFRNDFYPKTNRLNITTIELENKTGLVSQLINDVVWCFREGSIDEMSQLTNDAAALNNAISWEEGEDGMYCKCRAGWHGRDCGQPEVMWRALLSSKSRFHLQSPIKSNRLIFLLEGNFFSLDLLDLQISMLVDIVDYFVIFVKWAHKDLKAIRHLLRETLNRNNYLLFHCDGEKTSEKGNCTTAQAYAYFRERLQKGQLTLASLRPTDLLLYTDDGVLPSPKALKFLKHYAIDVRYVPFRLKYVVYGFYWQHPNQTKLNGLISSFVHLDNPSDIAGISGSSKDPAYLLQKILTADAGYTPPFVIGDLNHFGGWYCKYCQQPEEIVAELHAESCSLSQVEFPMNVRGRNVDVTYLQKIIANGIYVDGKTQLLRNRRYSDQYYAPETAEKTKAKFGNLLSNLYESFDDDIEYEGENY